MSHFPADFTPTDFLKEVLDTSGPLVLQSIKPSLSSASLNSPSTSRFDLHNDTPTHLGAALARQGFGIFPRWDLLIFWGSARVDRLNWFSVAGLQSESCRYPVFLWLEQKSKGSHSLPVCFHSLLTWCCIQGRCDTDTECSVRESNTIQSDLSPDENRWWVDYESSGRTCIFIQTPSGAQSSPLYIHNLHFPVATYRWSPHGKIETCMEFTKASTLHQSTCRTKTLRHSNSATRPQTLRRNFL